MAAHEIHCRQRFERGHIAATGHHDIGLAAFIIAGPFPNAHAGGAMLDRLVHGEPHGRGLFAGHNDVDIISAAQAMIGHGEQAISVWRQIYAHHFGLLVHDVIEETGVLM